MSWIGSCAGGKDQVTDRMECLKTGGADRSVIEIGRIGTPKAFNLPVLILKVRYPAISQVIGFGLFGGWL